MKIGYNRRLALWLLLVTVLLVVFCRVAEGYIDSESGKMLADIAPLAENIEAGEWQTAAAGLERAAAHWQDFRRVWLGLLSHREVWNIDEALISLRVYVQEGKTEEALNRLDLLAYYLERSREGDDVNWHNFF